MQKSWKGGRGGALDTPAVDEQQGAAQATDKNPEPSEALSDCPLTVKLLEFLKASDPSWEKQDKSCIMVLYEFTTRKNLQVRLPDCLSSSLPSPVITSIPREASRPRVGPLAVTLFAYGSL